MHARPSTFAIVLVAVLWAATRCGRTAPGGGGRRIMEFSAAFDDSRTAIDSEGKSAWEQGDRIKIYYDGGVGCVTATARSGGPVTTFVTDKEIPTDSDRYVAIYPASRKYSFRSGSFSETGFDIDFTEQMPATFADAAICSASTTVPGGLLTFRGCCAMVKFTTTSDKLMSASCSCGGVSSFAVVGADRTGYSAGTYYVPVPVGRNMTFSLRLRDRNGWTYPAVVRGPMDMEASHIYDIGVVEDVLAAEKTGTDGTLRLMSFNILRGDLQGPDHLWTSRRDACLAMIAADRPDILGLMECSSVQREDILDANPRYGFAGVAVSGVVWDHPSTSSNPIIYDGGKLLLEDWGTFWMSDTPDRHSNTWYYDKPRTFTWARLKSKAVNVSFIYVCMHLQDNSSGIKAEYAGNEGKYGPVNRKRATALIRSIIEERINPDGLPILLSGDCNCDAGSSDLAPLYEGGMFNLVADVAQVSDEGNTFNSYRSDGRSRIDHIFTQGPAHSLFAVERGAFAGVQFISDHWPVYTDFSFPASPSDNTFTTGLQDWTTENIQ